MNELNFQNFEDEKETVAGHCSTRRGFIQRILNLRPIPLLDQVNQQSVQQVQRRHALIQSQGHISSKQRGASIFIKQSQCHFLTHWQQSALQHVIVLAPTTLFSSTGAFLVT
jgi:hypothetical protein